MNKINIRCAAGLMFLLLLTSCSRGSDILKEEDRKIETTITLEGAKIAKNTFDRVYNEQRLRGRASEDQTILAFEQLNPKWELTVSNRYPDKKYSYYYTPLEAKTASLPIHSTVFEQDTISQDKSLTYGFIARYEDEIEPLNNNTFFLVFAPTTDFINNHTQVEFVPGEIPSDFSGDMYKFDLEGNLKRIHSYEDGALVDKKAFSQLPDGQENLRASVMTTCHTVVTATDWYIDVYVNGNKVEEGRYMYTTYKTSVECTQNVQHEVWWIDDDIDHIGGGGGGSDSTPQDVIDKTVGLLDITNKIEIVKNGEPIEDYSNKMRALDTIYRGLMGDPIFNDLIKKLNGRTLDAIIIDYDGKESIYNPSTNKITLKSSDTHALVEELIHFVQSSFYSRDVYLNENNKLALEAESKYLALVFKVRISKEDIPGMTPDESLQLCISLLPFSFCNIPSNKIVGGISMQEVAEKEKELMNKNYWISRDDTYEWFIRIQKILPFIGYKGEINNNFEYKLFDYVYNKMK